MIKLSSYTEGKALPSHTFPGCYPIYYISSYGTLLCPKCATALNECEHEDIIKADTVLDHYIDCECGVRIEGAYYCDDEGVGEDV